MNFGFIIIQQLVASVILDGGTLLSICVASVGVYWLSVLLFAIARREPLTALDVALMTAGFWPLAAVIAFAAHFVWWLKGLL